MRLSRLIKLIAWVRDPSSEGGVKMVVFEQQGDGGQVSGLLSRHCGIMYEILFDRSSEITVLQNASIFLASCCGQEGCDGVPMVLYAACG